MSPRGLAIPHSYEKIAGLDDAATGGHMRLLAGLHEWQFYDPAGPDDEFVISPACLRRRKSIAILKRGHDHLQSTTALQHRSREDLISAISQTGEADKLWAWQSAQEIIQRSADQLPSCFWNSLMSRAADAHKNSLPRKGAQMIIQLVQEVTCQTCQQPYRSRSWRTIATGWQSHGGR